MSITLFSQFCLTSLPLPQTSSPSKISSHSLVLKSTKTTLLTCCTNWEQGRQVTPVLGLVTPLTLLLRLNSVPSLVEIEDPGDCGDDGDDGDVGDGGVGEAGSDCTVPW